MAAEVKFILGRSGSGKTRAVFDAIKENELAGKKTLLIVPDRATFETERALSAWLGGGIMHTSVLSFTRLAHRVIDETGRKEAYLSQQGRLMLIRRILDEKKSELTAFSRVSAHRGFAEECDEIILKCKRFSIAPEELASSELPQRLADKLKDFSLVYSELTRRMQSRYIDGEDLVNSLTERLPSSSVRGAEVFIDAPDMISAQSVRIIETLFDICCRVNLTFRVDPACESANDGLFSPDIRSFRRLEASAKSRGCQINILRLTGNFRQTDAALARLETVAFCTFAAPFAFDARRIELHASADIKSEVTEVASRIRESVKHGLRYRDIAVAVSELSGYKETVRRIFSAYGIPFFMDMKRSVGTHPIAELILSSLRCAERNFRSEDFIRVMKTGLTGQDDDAIEKLENFILKFGLSGKRLYEAEPSIKNPDEIKDFELIEKTRLSIAAPIAELRRNLSADDERAASTRVEALVGYLDALGVGQKLKQDCEELEKSAETLAFALENRQIYDTVIELLDQIYVILGDERIGLSRFVSLVREGLDSYEVGIIPTTLDQVLVGDTGSIHLPEMKQLYVLGANEGRFPNMREDNAIINDRELELMRASGINAWETTEGMDRAEKLRVYSLITRPTELLYISYCRKSGTERLTPSRLVRSIGKLFPHSKRSLGGDEAVLGTDETALFALSSGLRELIDTGRENPLLAPLYSHFCAAKGGSSALEHIEEACLSANSAAPLGMEIAKKLYGDRLNGSVSRLQSFNECPFKHLMQYGLSLKEREVHELNTRDSGTLIHAAIEKLMQSLIDEKADFCALTKDDVTARLNEFLPEMFSSFNYGMLYESAAMRAEASRIERLLYDAAFVMVRQIAAGSFRPYANELGFGRREDDLPALEIVSSTGAKFRIRGIIDRLDRMTDENGNDYFRIIDYKNYNKGFDYTALANGISIQLPLYAAAMQAAFAAAGTVQTAGMYYFHIHAPDIEDEAERDGVTLREMRLVGPTLSEEEIIRASDAALSGRSSDIIHGLGLSKSSASGYSGALLVTKEEMEKTVECAKDIGAKTLDGIMHGRAEISPYRTGSRSACTYCPYISVCRFDTTAGGSYRRLRSLTADKFYGRKEKD